MYSQEENTEVYAIDHAFANLSCHERAMVGEGHLIKAHPSSPIFHDFLKT